MAILLDEAQNAETEIRKQVGTIKRGKQKAEQEVETLEETLHDLKRKAKRFENDLEEAEEYVFMILWQMVLLLYIATWLRLIAVRRNPWHHVPTPTLHRRRQRHAAMQTDPPFGYVFLPSPLFFWLVSPTAWSIVLHPVLPC